MKIGLMGVFFTGTVGNFMVALLLFIDGFVGLGHFNFFVGLFALWLLILEVKIAR